MFHEKWDVFNSYVKQKLEFQILESEFWFDDISTVEFSKKIRLEYPEEFRFR